MKILFLLCLAQLACACTPHEVRCGGRLEPINASAVTNGASGNVAASVGRTP